MEEASEPIDFLKSFSDPEAVANYTNGPKHFTPGLNDVYRMTGILLAEHVPDKGRVLVLGAGGGLETQFLADAYPGWTFVGVDPAGEMLKLAKETLGKAASRVDLIEGYIEDAPEGPFDGAICLLTLHFLDHSERLRTLQEIHKRLPPGAPFIAVHSSFPQGEGEREIWLQRYAAFAIASGFPAPMAERARDAVSSSIALFDNETDRAIIRDAGFSDAELFYRAFSWAGWVGHA